MRYFTISFIGGSTRFLKEDSAKLVMKALESGQKTILLQESLIKSSAIMRVEPFDVWQEGEDRRLSPRASVCNFGTTHPSGMRCDCREWKKNLVFLAGDMSPETLKLPKLPDIVSTRPDGSSYVLP